MVSKQHIGLAGEFRVMSELLMRGHNPAKSYLENGADVILENGKRIEIKCSTKYPSTRRKDGRIAGEKYVFTLAGGNRKKQSLDNVDFVICWAIDDNIFYIIPSKVITGIAVSITDISSNAKNRYAPFRDNWALLEDF